MLLIRDQLFARLCPRWQSLVVDAQRPAEKEGRDSQHLVLNTQLIAVPEERGVQFWNPRVWEVKAEGF